MDENSALKYQNLAINLARIIKRLELEKNLI